MSIDESHIPAMPGMGNRSGATVDYVDKIDLQTMAVGLIYWQHEAGKKMREVVAAFNAISELYRNKSDPEVKKFKTSRMLKSEFIEKEVLVLYPYSDAGQRIFEHNIQIIEESSGLIFELLVDLYGRLYQLRPEEESKREKVNEIPKHLQQPGGPTTSIETTATSPSFFDRFNIFKSNKSNYALDDILSPYRRTGRLLQELENTGNLEERLNAYHEFGVVDVSLGLGPEYQRHRMTVETYYLKTWVRPKILKLVKASGTLMVKEEQLKQEGVIGRSYEGKERHRPPDWIPQPTNP